MATRLETLLEKMASLTAKIDEEKAREAGEKAIGGLGADLAAFVTEAAKKASVDIKVLNGKFFALTVGDNGLSVALVSKANGNGNGKAKKASTATASTATAKAGKANGNGGEYEYFLKDGQGPYASIQEAMDATGIDKAQRPNHNRYDRLSAAWKGKIEQRAKVSQPASPPAAES